MVSSYSLNNRGEWNCSRASLNVIIVLWSKLEVNVESNISLQTKQEPGSQITIFIIYNPLASSPPLSAVHIAGQPSLLVWTGLDCSGVMFTPGLAYQTPPSDNKKYNFPSQQLSLKLMKIRNHNHICNTRNSLGSGNGWNSWLYRYREYLHIWETLTL